MIIDDLKATYQNSPVITPAYIRNALKETLQYYLLQYISLSPLSENLIFKGGACLRIFFDLPRLSDDLDFDWTGTEKFDIENFALSIKKYFSSSLQFNAIETKVDANSQTIYVKFPVLDLVGLPLTPSDSNSLDVRLDITPVMGSEFTTEPAFKSTRDFSFVLTRYSLPDLMAGKIAAILTRNAEDGQVQETQVRGKDYYDLIWFLEKGVVPNWTYLRQLTELSREKAMEEIHTKIVNINERSLQTELGPYFSNPSFVQAFSKNLLNLYNQFVPQLLSETKINSSLSVT